MHSHIKYLLIIFMLLAAVRGNTQNSVILGSVLSAEDKLPVSGAIVSLINEKNTVSTNVLGQYNFSGLFEGSYKIKIEFVGYKATTLTVNASGNDTIKPATYLDDASLTISQIDVTATMDYGKISVSPVDMLLRPTTTAQDLLRLVPGLFIAQHAGGGKAEQLFLRGFDIDHGTDISIQVDGMPVNMTSHAHGQGYADLHFVIPETIEGFDVYKGPYYSKFGDLATSGSVEFITKNSIEKNMVLFEYGKFDHYRGLVMLNVLGKNGHLLSKQKENLYVASEYTYADGYTNSPQKFSRLNAFGKYYGMLSDKTILSLSGSVFTSHWDASGQIPTRAVEQNIIDRYGSIDDTEGGNTHRTNVNVNLLNSLGKNISLTNQLYYTSYGFNLYSNFTFFLNDSLNGDQINQYEKRNIYGYKGVMTFINQAGSTNFTTNVGIGARVDDIDSIYLAHTVKRNFLDYTSAGKILQQNYFAYINETVELSDLIINPGLRVDYFSFDLTDDLNEMNSGKKTAVKFAPKLNLFYNLNSSSQLFVKTGLGFHSNDARVAVTEKNENTLPSALGYEAGASFGVGNGLFTASLWGLDIESEFVYVGDEAVVEPSGRTRRLGVDFTGRYQINEWSWADLDLNYSRGRFLDEPEGADRIPLAPVFTSVGGLSVKLNNGLSGRLGYRFIDDRPANEDNSVRAKGYFIVDAVLNYDINDRYRFGITFENLTDNKNFNEAQFDTESRLQFETDPVSELHYTPGTPFSMRGNFTIFF